MKQFLPIAQCPVRKVLSRIGDKWSMLVLITLHANGVMRFSDIHRAIGDVSHRMLSVTLKTLETDGMLHRKVYPQVPPKVEYQLTPIGESLIPHMHGLVEWASENMDQILESRQRADS